MEELIFEVVESDKVNTLPKEEKYVNDISDFFFKSLNDFILFTSGYFEMERFPPLDISFIEEDILIDISSLQTFFISSFASLFDGKLQVPALAIEYFLNNRIQSELIFRLAKRRNFTLDQDTFLKCLSGVDEKHYANMEEEDKLLNYLSIGSRVFAKDIFRTSSHRLFGLLTNENITRKVPFLNAIVTGLFSYFETKNIASISKDTFEQKIA
ncbi:MAG: hypothetical protein H7A23_16120 [Leptospiraceae bacterium]|nr:hypothetical protein [Leptospiraceae bacterium]MCP5496073.1 hypothetical protein [Leptospiraceae bacterium]